MKRQDTDSELELTALQWFEQMQAMDVGEVAVETHRRWLETPANAEAYAKVERIFTLTRALAGNPEIALLSEETNKRIANRPIEDYVRRIPETPTKPNKTQIEP